MRDTPYRAAAGSSVETNRHGFMVELEDGRVLACPWSAHPALKYAETAQQRLCRLTADRRTVRWPYLWFELRVAHLAELARVAGSLEIGAPMLLPSRDALEVA